MNELEIIFFNPANKSSEIINGDLLQTLWKEPLGFFWIDINNPDTEALTEVLSSLDINCTWTNHFDSPEILPRFHDVHTAISFYMYGIENVESLSDTSQNISELVHTPLLIVLGSRFIITYHQKPMDLISYLKANYSQNFILAGKTPGFLAFLIFQHALFNYARLNLMNDNFLDSLEFGMISGNVTDEIQRITTAGYNILTLKKLNANLHIILLMLSSKQSYVIGDEARVSFNLILKETISIRESIDSSRYMLDSIMSGMQTQSTQRTSEIMRLLTITSCIFMPLSLITGIFGMNFFNIPGLQWKYGFSLSIAAMGVIVLTFVSILRHLGWIGKK